MSSYISRHLFSYDYVYYLSRKVMCFVLHVLLDGKLFIYPLMSQYFGVRVYLFIFLHKLTILNSFHLMVYPFVIGIIYDINRASSNA